MFGDAIFNWVVKNIHKPPEGFDIIDDHALNIIIRRYGTGDQMADVFTTLCVYCGIPAFCRFESSSDGNKRLMLSYVRLDNEWKVFDVYHNVYFLNNRGEIANIEDIISNPSIDISYQDFFKNLKPIRKNFISKAEKQVPFLRIKYEIQRFFAKIFG